MQIDISELRSRGDSEELQGQLGLPSTSEIKFCEPVSIDAHVTNTGEIVIVSGTISAVVSLVCSRCGEVFNHPIKFSFSEEYQRPGADLGDDEEEGSSNSPAPLDDNFIDVDKLVSDLIFTELPMKPLCREDCKGLCPVCGQNLNEGECDCNVETVDPRLAPLRELLANKKERNGS